MAELKPCPFCGGEAIIMGDETIFGFTMLCKKCRAYVYFDDAEDSKDLTIDKWNRRADNEAD